MASKKKTSEQPTPPASVFDVSDVMTKDVAKPYVTKRQLVLGGIGLTLIVILGIGLYYHFLYQRNQQLLRNPLLASEVTQEQVVAKVGQLTTVPQNEKPTIAIVSDTTKLQDQPFFQNAKDGDYVLIYSKAKEAIIYDPKANKIVRVGPVTINTDTSVQGTTTSNQPTPSSVTVALYNGTTITGLTKKVQKDLVTKMPAATVVQNANAVKQDYTQTLVIDLTGKNAVVAEQLANVLHGTVGSLPKRESKPSTAEILVILGQVVTPTP